MATIAPLDHTGGLPAAGPAAGEDGPRWTSGAAGAIASAVFGTWVVVGLFVDGWAHIAGKPESFWTPWHAVLYSGFLTGAGWFALASHLDRRRGTLERPDPLLLAGFGLFAAGGLADMTWHTLFGVEKDIEALFSPSHLLLMVAGLLIVTAPVRGAAPAAPDSAGQQAGWRSFGAVAVGLTLAVAILAFFTQFASALHAGFPDVFATGATDELQILGVAGVLLPNGLLVGALLWTAARWPSPPVGTFTLVFGATALLMAGLDGFDQLALVLPVAAGGALADVLVRRGVPLRAVAVAVPVLTWSGWFAVYHLAWGLGWPAELTSGTVAFAALGGHGLGLLVHPPAHPVVRSAQG
jgi:hypothetical protein